MSTSDVPEPEIYYTQLWNRAFWSSEELNMDEQLRTRVILRFIENHVLPLFSTEVGLRILDLGCGRGWLTNTLGYYGHAMGIDPVRAGIMTARELYPALDFRVGTAADLLADIGPAQFGLIVSTEVMEHVVDGQKQDFMTVIYSLLVPGGFAILTTPRGELWTAWKGLGSEEQPIEQWISETDLDQLSRSSGFRVVTRDRVFLPQFSYNWTSRVATSKFFCFLVTHFPRSRLVAKLCYHCGIYQVILLKRP